MLVPRQTGKDIVKIKHVSTNLSNWESAKIKVIPDIMLIHSQLDVEDLPKYIESNKNVVMAGLQGKTNCRN
ncbi:MAG: hypothetical protein LBE09_01700 [Christensenellaceae bacterium]|nr:hypothetical protein [Christensenellaceae bacterium]